MTVFAGIAVQVKTINNDDDAYDTEMQQVRVTQGGRVIEVQPAHFLFFYFLLC